MGLADGRDVAIDLGTANTLVYVRGQGIVLSEPSVIAVDTTTNDVHAVGRDAQRMIGRTPATISAVRPLRHGVIADFATTEQMLRYFLRRAHQRRFGGRARVVMCAPGGITKVEQRAVEEACLSAGARQVALIEEPMAAAIGGGLPVDEAKGSMVVDIGGGTSEVAVISLGGMVVSRSVRVGGYEFDDAIIGHIRRAHSIAIGQPTAEELKFQLGSALPLGEELEADVRGRDLISGLPKNLRLTSEEVRETLEEPLQAIIEAVKETLEETPPELAADISERGIMLAGGGSLLRGFDARLHEETGMDVYLAESPLTCVAAGAGQSLEEFETLVQAQRAARRRVVGKIR
jgi:rod shape-determining protein MreB and related proteins